MAQEQIQLEFKDEIAQIQQMTQQLQQMGATNPQMMQQNPQMMEIKKQLDNLNTQMEARKSVLVAETTLEYLEEEKKVLNQIDNDPLLRLKADEVQLRAQENMRKQKDDEEQLNLDKARLLQARELAEDKMELNDKHQKLRASVSLAKDGIKQMTAVVGEEK
jgi:hypothetical protein